MGKRLPGELTILFQPHLPSSGAEWAWGGSPISSHDLVSGAYLMTFPENPQRMACPDTQLLNTQSHGRRGPREGRGIHAPSTACPPDLLSSGHLAVPGSALCNYPVMYQEIFPEFFNTLPNLSRHGGNLDLHVAIQEHR